MGIGEGAMKDFKTDLLKIYHLLKRNEHFSFTRFSDGELFLMQQKRLILAQNHVIVGDIHHNFGYNKEDQKDYDPEKHGYVGEAVLEAFKHKQHNYFVGLSCPCCVSKEDSQWMKDLRDGDEEFTTWANLFVNANYPLFIKNFYPLLKHKKCVIVCNENANIRHLDLDIIRDFRIGTNAIVNDFNLPDKIQAWIEEDKIEDHVFLLAATSISNLIAHKSFSKNPRNTFLDIGSTLNKHLGMGIARDYLKKFWHYGYTDLRNYKYCIWE